MNSESTARQVVMSFVNALNDEDFRAARRCVWNDVSFVGVLGSLQGADAYFNDMERLRLKYDVRKVFTDGGDVCLLYDVAVSGVTVFSCGWYQVEGGRIKSLRVVFDPRPIVEPPMKLAQRAS